MCVSWDLPVSEAQAYPLFKGRVSDLPRRGTTCPVCARKDLSKAPESVTLIGGAVTKDGESESFGPSDSSRGILDLYWNLDLTTPNGPAYAAAALPIAKDVRGGQFSIKVCSIACLRRLFAGWVAELASRVREEKERAGLGQRRRVSAREKRPRTK